MNSIGDRVCNLRDGAVIVQGKNSFTTVTDNSKRWG